MPVPMFCDAALVGWAALLLARDGFKFPPVTRPTFKRTHVIPVAIQLVLFGYWTTVSSDAYWQVPFIALQLVFAYSFDWLLAWTMRRPWGFSFAPVPVVFSTNLFIWFVKAQLHFDFAIIALALLSKEFLRRNGRHIFNPSAFGMAVIALFCLGSPGICPYRDISHGIASPPHMEEFVFIVTLVPLFLVRTAPIAVGAASALTALMFGVSAVSRYHGGPDPWWPPWLIAITLLAGDPATVPASQAGRLLFGLFIGTSYYVFSRTLVLSGHSDFFSKVLPMPAANLLVPWFDRTGATLRIERFKPRAYLAAWVAISLLNLAIPYVFPQLVDPKTTEVERPKPNE